MPLGDSHLRRDRAESFGRIADDYDRFRPTYPDAVMDDLASRGGVDALDVGCGTGLASRQLSARGMRVLGVELDAAMAAVARRHGVDVEVATFEAWDDRGRRFDLLLAAQSWHWIDPAVGARKAFAVLRPGGTLALLWNLALLDEDLVPVVEAVYAREAPDLEPRGRQAGGQPAQPTLDNLAAAGFAGPVVREFPWTRTYPTAEWLGMLATFSDHQLMDADRRAALLAALGEAVGPQVRLHLDTKIVTATRRG